MSKNKKSKRDKKAQPPALPANLDSQLQEIYQTDNIDPIALSVRSQQNVFSVQNSMTGIGTARDPLSYNTLNSEPLEDLDTEVIWSIYDRSSIMKNIITTYPKESDLGSISVSNAEVDTASIDSHFSSRLKSESLHKIFTEAAIESRLYGVCWVLIGVEDGQTYDQPVNEDSIKFVDRFLILTKQQVIPTSKFTGVYKFRIGQNIYPIHESRLLTFTGETIPVSKQEELRYTGVSIVKSLYDAFILYKPSLFTMAEMLSDFTVFCLGIEGLEQKMRKSPLAAEQRFLNLQMLKSTTRGIAYDKETEIPHFISRTVTGASELHHQLEKFLVAESRMVRHKVLGGATEAGLGNVGKGELERYTHSQNIKRWQQSNYHDNLLRVYRYYFLSEQGITGGILPDFNVIFNPKIELTPEEIANIFKINVETMKTAVEAGFITTEQATKALFGSNEVVLNPVINVSINTGESTVTKSENDNDGNAGVNTSVNDQVYSKDYQLGSLNEEFNAELNRQMELNSYFTNITNPNYKIFTRDETNAREGLRGRPIRYR